MALEWELREQGPTDATHTVLLLPGGMCSAGSFAELMAEPALAGMRLVAATLPAQAGAPPPLSVDLAPPQLVGRYTAAASISWQIGWIVGPAAGGFLLQHRPLLLWPIAAAVNVACAAAALALEPRLPARVRRTPQEERVVVPIPASG